MRIVTVSSRCVCMACLQWRRRQARAARDCYGTPLRNEPETPADVRLVHPLLALSPLVLVGVTNFVLTLWIPRWYGTTYTLQLPGMSEPVYTDVDKLKAIWAVEGTLILGVLLVLVSAFRVLRDRIAEGGKTEVAGSLLTTLNTASEYGFGALIATLQDFLALSHALARAPGMLVNEAVSVTALAGITGSASGGLSIALAAMANTFLETAHAAGIPPEVLHRVAAMASGGMDTLPHNGAVIALLAVTGLTHREAYKDIFCITLIKLLAVYYATGIV